MIAGYPLSDGERIVLTGESGTISATVIRVFRTLADTDLAADRETPTFTGMARQLLSLAGVEAAALLIVGCRTPMFLVGARGMWYDVQRKPVVVTPIDGGEN